MTYFQERSANNVMGEGCMAARMAAQQWALGHAPWQRRANSLCMQLTAGWLRFFASAQLCRAPRPSLHTRGPPPQPR